MLITALLISACFYQYKGSQPESAISANQSFSEILTNPDNYEVEIGYMASSTRKINKQTRELVIDAIKAVAKGHSSQINQKSYSMAPNYYIKFIDKKTFKTTVLSVFFEQLLQIDHDASYVVDDSFSKLKAISEFID